jgi:hypothetical protein
MDQTTKLLQHDHSYVHIHTSKRIYQQIKKKDVSIGSVLGALLAVLVSTLLIRVLFLLVWKPYAVSRWFRGQGVGGPSYRFFVGSLPEIKQMKAAGSKIVLDVGSHDFIPIVQPQYRKWVAEYGT